MEKNRAGKSSGKKVRSTSDLLVAALQEEGVKYIFGVPGEENLAFLEAVRSSGIQFIPTRHEQAAAFMAATYGRLTGRAGVALSTLGPGATNAITGVAYAQLGGMPLVLITGQKPIKKSKQGRFQIIDVIGMMRPITKMAERIISSDRVPSLVRDAFRTAEEERPGAVHLELPEDVAAEDAGGLVPLPRIKSRRPGPDPKAVAQALAMLAAARHPLILVAAGANRKLVRKHLTRFIEKTGIPFATTQMGKGVIPEDNDRYIGTTALSGSEEVHAAIDHADLVLMVGHDVSEKPPAMLGQRSKKIIHINFYPAVVDDVYFPDHEIVGDISHALWALTEDVSPATYGWDFSRYEELIRAARRDRAGGADSDVFPMALPRVAADLRASFPKDAIFSLDNGMYKLWFARNLTAYEQNTILLDNAFATMGAGLPAAIGAKLVHPERQVVAVAGDGGFMMNSQELETAMRLKLDLIVVILRDNAYGMIEWKQKSMRLPSFGLSFGNPDFVAYAKSYGAGGHLVKKAADLVPLLKKAVAQGGVQIIEVPVNYREYEDVFLPSAKTKRNKRS